MDAIDKIVTKIIEKGTNEVQEFEQKEQLRIEQSFAAQKEELQLQESHLIQKNEQYAQKQFKQKQNRQQLEVRQEVLNKKQEYLEKLFQQTIQMMNQWPQEEFLAFTKTMLQQLSLKGEADFLVGEYSQTYITQEWLAQQETGVSLKLAREPIEGEGGFIISKDGIEYNFLFSTLIREIQKQESYTIAAELFK